MKKHLLIAAVMTPFLMLAGYTLTDWYLNRDRQPAALNMLQTMDQSCMLTAGCTLFSGDFTFTIRQQGNRLSVITNQRLENILMEVVDAVPPQPMTRADEAGYRWTLTLPDQTTAPVKLRWVAKSHWRNYIGEWP